MTWLLLLKHKPSTCSYVYICIYIGGASNIMVIVVGNYTATRVQNLDEAVCSSDILNTLRKGIYLIIHSAAIGKWQDRLYTLNLVWQPVYEENTEFGHVNCYQVIDLVSRPTRLELLCLLAKKLTLPPVKCKAFLMK